MATREPTTPDDPSLDLALAVVAASTAPLVLLDDTMTVLAASNSFCRAYDLDCQHVRGQSLFAMGAGEWDVPQLRSLLAMTASGDAEIDAYDFRLQRPDQPARRLVLNAQKLIYGDVHRVRLLLAVSDVTDAHADAVTKEELAREHAMLLKEVRHRVANSLQIIASVLLQGARNTQSEETRGQLHNAHFRLMSVATLERQLAASTIGEVELNSYFAKLCASIGASMIADPKRVRLTQVTDASTVDANISVSMGLIVTELVINAIKHAFPNGRDGTIAVGFVADGKDWSLSVTDDGVGMPRDGFGAAPGLGTSIVLALAKQLGARVVVSDASPGTKVLIQHNAAAIASHPAENVAQPAV